MQLTPWQGAIFRLRSAPTRKSSIKHPLQIKQTPMSIWAALTNEMNNSTKRSRITQTRSMRIRNLPGHPCTWALRTAGEEIRKMPPQLSIGPNKSMACWRIMKAWSK